MIDYIASMGEKKYRVLFFFKKGNFQKMSTSSWKVKKKNILAKISGRAKREFEDIFSKNRAK